MSFYTEECTKEFRVDKKRLGVSPATSPLAKQELRVNMLTHCDKKTPTTPEGLSRHAALC
jgi:hypothetical protein